VFCDLERSADRVKEELNENAAAIFRAHQSILNSRELLDELLNGVDGELVNAEEIVQRVFWRWERRFGADRDSASVRYADDVADLSGRLLRALAGIHAHPLENVPAGSVLVASRLLPSDTVHLSRGAVVAVLAAQAGRGSHAALLTTERGIPGVAQLPDILASVSSGDTVLVDGFTGAVVLRPDEATTTEFRQRVAREQESTAAVRERRSEEVQTSSGIRVHVAANVGSREDALLAAESGADGIGLCRLESLLMRSSELPSESQLLSLLRTTLEPFSGKPVTVRLLDAGGDKPVPWLDLPAEANPFLGRRGLRLLFHYPRLLESQLRTLLHLSREHNLRVLVPMVTVAEEMKKVRELAQQIASGIGIVEAPPIGAMIETPAAALCCDDIAVHADFVSLGTNDLTQYTMAADRENPTASEYFQDDHRAVWKLIETACEQAGRTPVYVCGKLAGRVDAVPRLLKLGIRGLSVAPPLVPAVKHAVGYQSI
jgi:phosphoenolpyruvate-protein phosphotransferase